MTRAYRFCEYRCIGRKGSARPSVRVSPVPPQDRPPMFDLDRFIADCIDAQAADPSHKLVQQVVARAISDCAGVLHGLGEPRRAQMQKLYHSPRLTILNIIWAPGMTMVPHDHRMWAVIGLYTGREDNTFWRRIKADPHGRV